MRRIIIALAAAAVLRAAWRILGVAVRVVPSRDRWASMTLAEKRDAVMRGLEVGR